MNTANASRLLERTMLRPCHGLLLLSLWVVPSSVLAQSKYAIGDINVSKGHPIAGVGSILVQSFDTSCNLVPDPTQGEETPLAGSISGNIELELEILSCPGWLEKPEEAPPLTCSQRIDDGPAQQIRMTVFSRAIGAVTYRAFVVVPESVGIYKLTLDCSIGPTGDDEAERRQTIHRRLFATYGEPLVSVSPPEIAWYERAASWGEGIGSTNTERDVMSQLLDRLYHYGQKHWRYGFGIQDEEGYWFGGGDSKYRVDVSASEIDLSDGTFRCTWQALMDEHSSCNFADCYIFSRVLQFAAATLGIGGVTHCDDCIVRGEDDAGFMTVPGRESLDPGFKRNIYCGKDVATSSQADPAPCNAYFFGSHSLVRRYDTYYDPTFAHTYKNPREAVGMSIQAKGKAVITLANSPAVVTRISDGGGQSYGNWSFFLYSGLTELQSPRELDGGIHFTDEPVEFHRIHRDQQHEIYEALEAQFEVEVVAPNAYSVSGYLSADTRDETGQPIRVASRPRWNSVRHTEVNIQADKPGKYPVTLEFSGEEIRRSGINGPYRLTAYFGGQAAGEKTAETPLNYQYQQFGESDVVIKRKEITWALADSPENSGGLLIYVPLDVREQSTFAVQLSLLGGDQAIAYGGKKCESLPCQPYATMMVRREDFENTNPRDVYELTVEVFSLPGLVSMDASRTEIRNLGAVSVTSSLREE